MTDAIMALTGAVSALAGFIVFMQRSFLRHVAERDKRIQAAWAAQIASNERIRAAIQRLTAALHGRFSCPLPHVFDDGHGTAKEPETADKAPAPKREPEKAP